MLGRNLGLAISCALGAGAILLPPGVSSDNAVLPFVSFDPKHQLLELPCPTCSDLDRSDLKPFESDQVSEGTQNLLLNLSISEDGQALLLNEEQLYPHDYAIEDIVDLDWTIQEVSPTWNRKQLESKSYVGTPRHITGHMYSTSPMDMLTPDGDGIITIRWQLLALEHEMMPVDEVLIQLLHTGDGELLILSADLVPMPADIITIKPFLPVDAPKRPTKDCKYLPGPLCKMGNFIDSKLVGSKNSRPGCGGAKKFDPFAGRLPTHIKPHFGASKDDAGPPYGHPHMPPPFPDSRPHDGHHGHRHHHSLFHAIGRGIAAILVPVMLGIGVGLLVLPLGLLTGHFLGWLWFTVIQGNKRGYARVALEESSATGVDKSEEQIEGAEPLPLYEEAPAYEDIEKEAL